MSARASASSKIDRTARATAAAAALSLLDSEPVWARPLGDDLLLFVRVNEAAVAAWRDGMWSAAGRSAGAAQRMEDVGVPSPLEIVAAVAFRSTAGSALLAVGPFASVCTRAVVLPRNVAERSALETEATVTGVGVLVAAGDGRLEVVCPAQTGPIVGSRRGLVHRMVEESVYESLVGRTVGAAA